MQIPKFESWVLTIPLQCPLIFQLAKTKTSVITKGYWQSGSQEWRLGWRKLPDLLKGEDAMQYSLYCHTEMYWVRISLYPTFQWASHYFMIMSTEMRCLGQMKRTLNLKQSKQHDGETSYILIFPCHIKKSPGPNLTYMVSKWCMHSINYIKRNHQSLKIYILYSYNYIN